MRIEIDQSGKIEDTTKDTILAFSDDKSYTVLIPSVVKRHLIRKYSRSYKRRIKLYIKIFSIGLFYLIRKIIKSIDLIIIDREYEGHENNIKSILLSHIRKIYPNFEKRKIVFYELKRDSKAHEIAVRTLRDELEENEVVDEKKIEELL